MGTISDKVIVWLQDLGISQAQLQWIMPAAAVLLILLVAFVLDRICRKLMIPIVKRLTGRTGVKWDEMLFNDEVLNNICHLVTPIVSLILIPMAFPPGSEMLTFILKLCNVYLVIVVLKLLCSLINSLYVIVSGSEKRKDRSVKGFYQTIKLVVICIGVIVIISTLIDKSPAAILTGLGAGAAILMLVFQDTIKGLVAGVQLTANDMLRPGDWISMPKYGADGDVIEVSLTTVKVRNWDKTITTIPPYALVNDSFQNWRGMFDTGGRRVKRSLNIDMNSVRFCSAEEMEHYRQQPWMEGYEEAQGDVVNLHIFRQYIDFYLRHHAKVHQDMLILVRQLQPTAEGLPLELYFFSASTVWVNYEALQSEVFEHVLAMAHKFGVAVFQRPSGQDLQSISVK